MAAATTDRLTKSKGTVKRLAYPVKANTKIFAGTMVCTDSTGFAVPAADTAAFSTVRGIATAQADNTGGANAAIDVVVEFNCEFLLGCTGAITQVDVGQLAMAADDQTVSDAAAMTNDVRVGRIVELVSASTCWVYVDGT